MDGLGLSGQGACSGGYVEGKPNFTADFPIVSTLSSMGGKYQSNLGSDGSVIYRMQFVA